MVLSLPKNELKSYLGKQLDSYFPDAIPFSGSDIDCALDLSLERLEKCFQGISFPAYSDAQGQTYFSHLHGDQYAHFLYFFANSLWELSENKVVCDKVIYLNRVLNNFFVSYKGKMPDIFFFAHPIGSIIGNADYSNYLVISQGVTINTDHDEDGNPAPKLGKGLFLGAGAKIIGNKQIGDRVSVGVDTLIHQTEIADDKVVYTDNEGKVCIVDRKKECAAQLYFRDSLI
ncbi:MAG: hypothetical protein MR799_04480 [Lachnospiraceae bacterium]|nr:hypothetical protein [Lachnospiraceae bacterium]